MSVISKSALVPYSSKLMYDLVNDIKSYPLFLSWCQSATILNEYPEHIEASLTILKGKIKGTFTTKNHLIPHQKITMKLMNSSFIQLNHLTGQWVFKDIGDFGCRVSIDLNFNIQKTITNFAIEKLLKRQINIIVDQFIQRAHQLYQ